MFDQLLVMRCAWTPARRILICLPVWLALCVLISPIKGQFNSTENPTALNNEFLKLQPQHLSAQELAQALQLAIGNQGSLTVLDSRDTVLVAGPPEILQRAVRMMEQVDTPRAQVRIAVYVFDVPLEDSKQLAIAAAKQLAAQATVSNGQLLDMSTDISASGQNPFHVLASQLELNQALKLLATISNAKLLVDPLVTVLDRQTATFDTMMRIPSTVSSNVERPVASSPTNLDEAGIRLALTPRILHEGNIELRMAAEYSSVIALNAQGAPVIDSRRADTIIRTSHGQTIVIGGLRKRAALEALQTVPSLINRKVTAPMFRTVGVEPSDTELICILRPEIVGPPTWMTPDLALRANQPLQPAPGALAASNLERAPLAARNEASSVIQNSGYQEATGNPALDQVKPSAYRPSVYNTPARTAPARTMPAPSRTINSSRNSVTQPLPVSFQKRS